MKNTSKWVRTVHLNPNLEHQDFLLQGFEKNGLFDTWATLLAYMEACCSATVYCIV
tara:strand:+ start:295 stop:462 length:168 start_codon:yes stop_codon:yes gene_type:complete